MSEPANPTVTAFIEARLAEDAAIAQAAADAGAEPTWEADRGQVLTGGLNDPVWLMDSLSAGDAPLVHAARHDPARVLREVEAKRALAALVHQEDGIASADEAIKYEWGSDSDMADQVLKWLAHPYSDHPDYNPAWRVT